MKEKTINKEATVIKIYLVPKKQAQPATIENLGCLKALISEMGADETAIMEDLLHSCSNSP